MSFVFHTLESAKVICSIQMQTKHMLVLYYFVISSMHSGTLLLFITWIAAFYGFLLY